MRRSSVAVHIAKETAYRVRSDTKASLDANEVERFQSRPLGDESVHLLLSLPAVVSRLPYFQVNDLRLLLKPLNAHRSALHPRLQALNGFLRITVVDQFVMTSLLAVSLEPGLEGPLAEFALYARRGGRARVPCQSLDERLTSGRGHPVGHERTSELEPGRPIGGNDEQLPADGAVHRFVPAPAGLVQAREEPLEDADAAEGVPAETGVQGVRHRENLVATARSWSVGGRT